MTETKGFPPCWVLLFIYYFLTVPHTVASMSDFMRSRRTLVLRNWLRRWQRYRQRKCDGAVHDGTRNTHVPKM